MKKKGWKSIEMKIEELTNLCRKQNSILYVLWTVHHDTHTWERPTRCTPFLISISRKLFSTCFEHVIVHRQEEFCTRSLQYFTVLLKRKRRMRRRNLVAETIRMIRSSIIRIVSATRLLVLVIIWNNNNKNYYRFYKNLSLLRTLSHMHPVYDIVLYFFVAFLILFRLQHGFISCFFY